MGRNILICYDLSKASKHAIEWTINKNIILPDDNVVVANVLNDDILSAGSLGGFQAASVGVAEVLADGYKQSVCQLEDQARASLQEVIEEFHARDLNVATKQLNGDAAESLKKYAEDNDMEIVIVGSRGLGFFQRKFLGSVSLYLSKHLKCSVLIVKTDHC